MNQVEVSKTELLEKLKTNRNTHRDTFLKAQEGYRRQVIQELDRMLQEAKNNQPIRRSIQLPEPQDHTEDYDNVIAMLEMSVDDTIVLSSHEFSTYVRDQWAWSGMVQTSNAFYIQ